MMKRLFVGGLSSGINEKDIRERFKTFGSVSSVEVHRRQKSEGFPEKTFAYVDIDTSDSNIQRCITTLSNTKWKGGILKIQLAKESFLSRLQKEREELKSKVDNKESKPSQLPSELTSAAPNSLPGTLIPGKKDWVVGKFGRVLPIVHMRQTGSRKICRIDPSKTVHNVRRIKDDGEERPVSELTWSLERANGENVFINGNKHEEEGDESDSSTSEETIIAPAMKKKKTNSRRNEIENVNETEKMELWEGKSKMKDSSLKKYLSKKLSGHKDGLKSHEVNEGFKSIDDNDNVIKDTPFGHIDVADKNIKSTLAQAKSSKKKTKKKRKTSDSSDSDQEDSIPHALLADESAVLEQRKSKSMKEHRSTSLDKNLFQSTENKSMSLDRKTDLKIGQNDFEMQDVEKDLILDDKIDEKKSDKRKERKRKKKSNDDMLSDVETTTNELQFSNKKMREKENNEGDKNAESGGKNNEKQKKQLVKKEENQAKKLTSNERRLQAAQEREASLLSKQSLIASALKNLDNNEKVKKVNHIKFDNEYEEEEQVIGGKEEKTKGKISGPQASNWLGLDSASDDDDDAFPDKQGVEEHLLATKPQFEGETGHKLFQLQKSYKGDSRFQLDERFAESDDESAPENENDTKRHFRGDTVHSSDSHVKVSNDDDDDDDDISKQLSREKDLSMSVLRGILGHNVFADNSSTKEKFTDSTMIHYDPTRDDHAQFENKPKKQDSPVPVVKETASQQEATKVMRSAPEVTREKFFDVKENVLTEMFGKNKSDDSTTGFKFLSDQDPAEDTGTSGPNWGVPEELRSKPWNPVMLPYDSSGDEEEQNMESEDEEQHVQTALEERFFFHFGDPDLEGCVGDEDSLFMRTKSLDELHQYWITTRSELTQDYKKKHKDAVKRQRKMAAKRARTR